VISQAPDALDDVLADPVGVIVDLISDLEPNLAFATSYAAIQGPPMPTRH
jgi:hypothetical protein